MSPPSFGVYGKIPARGDFVRLGAGGPLVRGLADWLQESNERLYRSNTAWPTGASYFLYRSADPDAVALGALAPSRDRAGRTFPIAAFVTLPTADALAEWSLLPRLFAGTLANAAHLVLSCDRVDLDALAGQASGLSLPPASARPQARVERERDLGASPAAGLWAALGDLARGYYAMNTLSTACRNGLAGGETGGARLASECPIRRSVDLEFWLLAIERSLRLRHAPPSFLWAKQSLLVAFGAPPPTLALALADPSVSQHQIWSLKTDQSDAIIRARDALPAGQRRAIESGTASLWELAQTFAPTK